MKLLDWNIFNASSTFDIELEVVHDHPKGEDIRQIDNAHNSS